MTYNILYYNSSDGAITQFSSADLNQLAEYILEIMASGTYAGTISVGTSNPIGTFTDTVRQGAVGSTGITILSNTYTLSQTNTVQSTAGDPPQYMGLTVAGDVTTLQQNLTTLDDLADEILQVMVGTYGVNSYYLGTNAPADGGTWVSRGNLTDTLQNFAVLSQNWKLWHKVSAATYTGFKNPLKLAGNELQQWTQAEVEALVKKVEERIVSTSIGSYVLQSSVPASGTWVNVGTVTDVRRETQVTNFTATDNYIGPIYTGQVIVSYIGPEQSYTRSFATSSYTQDGPDAINYIGRTSYSGPTVFIGGNVYTNDSIPSVYTGDRFGFTTSYVGPSRYFGPVGPENQYTGEFTFTTFPSYFGPGTVTYLGATVLYDGVEYLGGTFLAGIETPYTSTYASSVSYEGTVVSATLETVSTVTLWKRIL